MGSATSPFDARDDTGMAEETVFVQLPRLKTESVR